MITLKLGALALVLSLGLNSAVNAKEYTILLDQSGSSRKSKIYGRWRHRYCEDIWQP